MTSAIPAKGMRDLLPGQVATRDWATARILEVYASYGFTRIETPAVENLSVLVGAQGGENEKLIFKILKRGEKLSAADSGELADLGLRFDLTVPLARYYAHLHASLPQPLRAIQIGPVWRADQPQKGRYRQFTQCDIDILGLGSPLAEIELIRATVDALAEVTLRSFTVRVNDRRILMALVTAAGFAEAEAGTVLVTLDKMDKVGVSGVQRELVGRGFPAERVSAFLTSVAEIEKRAMANEADLGWVDLRVDRGAVTALATIIRSVRADQATWSQGGASVDIRFDPTLVRGMGYYTGPIFEISEASYTSSIAGGGRYDDMIGRFLGRTVPACGFSIGFERLMDILEERGAAAAFASARTKVALLVDEALEDLTPVLTEARARRADGAVVIVEPRHAKNAGRQIFQLAKDGFTDGRVYRADGTAEDIGTTLRSKRAASAEGV
ncbi:MAG: histidine--tRNA ligase [Candidatus Rokubacteria bacterium]|nr:histidine--tRNA ligase [Candidatus Rokubacteria bacterium]